MTSAESIDPAILPARILLCMDPGCYGEFYLPLDLDERIGCPHDHTHPVAVYSTPILHKGEDE